MITGAVTDAEALDDPRRRNRERERGIDSIEVQGLGLNYPLLYLYPKYRLVRTIRAPWKGLRGPESGFSMLLSFVTETQSFQPNPAHKGPLRVP